VRFSEHSNEKVNRHFSGYFCCSASVMGSKQLFGYLQPQLIVPLILKSDVERTRALIASIENEESECNALLYC